MERSPPFADDNVNLRREDAEEYREQVVASAKNWIGTTPLTIPITV